MRSSGDRDHKNVPQFFSLFEMDDVARMNQVKSAVTMDDSFALPPQIPEDGRSSAKRENF